MADGGFQMILAMFVSAATAPAFAAAQTQPKALVEAAYKKWGANVSGLKRECVTFDVSPTKTNETTVVEKEVHNKTCGGDPATSPTVATFVVRGKQVLIVDPVSGKTIPFNASFKSDGP